MDSVHNLDAVLRIHLIFQGIQAIRELIDQRKVGVNNRVKDYVQEMIGS
jgi:hypothetical protein